MFLRPPSPSTSEGARSPGDRPTSGAADGARLITLVAFSVKSRVYVAHHVRIAVVVFRAGHGRPGRLLVGVPAGGSGQRQLDGGRGARFVQADPAGSGDRHGADVFVRCDR